jgi:hypothetical protein
MATIWKYELKAEDEQVLIMPAGAKILSAQVQNHGFHDAICIWAIVDPNTPSSKLEKRKFRIIGTGHPFNDADNLTFISTVQMYDGKLVFHVFEAA